MADQPHTLTVTFTETGDAPDNDEFEYDLRCPSPGSCGTNLWTDCPTCVEAPSLYSDQEQDAAVASRHGVEHRYFHEDSRWLVETDRCYGVYWSEYEGLFDAMDTASYAHPEICEPGEHQVHVLVEDDSGVVVEPWREP